MSKSKLHRQQVQRGTVMPDYEIIYLIPDGDGGATWCEDPAPGSDMEEEDAIKYRRVKDNKLLRSDYFKYFSQNHNLTLTESEIDDVISFSRL